MNELRFTVGPEGKGTRIDKYVALKLGEGYSRVYARSLIEGSFVLVNGGKIKPRYIAKQGDEVLVRMPAAGGRGIEAENIPVRVLYEDDCVIVVDKPAGMVVHPGAGNNKSTLVNALLYHCRNLPDTGDELRPGIVHRLDRDTSGVLVAAKNDRALRSLSKQFQKRTVKKRYIALVSGRVVFDNGVVDIPIARHAVTRQKMDVAAGKGRSARTVYHVVRRFHDFTLLRLEPETGRTHQIRVHMRHIGHPVLGDRIYGKAGGMDRQALHAEMIGFSHPDTGEYMEFYSPVPDDIMEVIRKSGLPCAINDNKKRDTKKNGHGLEDKAV